MYMYIYTYICRSAFTALHDLVTPLPHVAWLILDALVKRLG